MSPSTLAQAWQRRRWRLVGAGFVVGYLTLTRFVLAPAGAALWQQRAHMIEQRTHVEQARAWATTEQPMRARIHSLRAMLRRVRRGGAPASSVAALLTPLDDAARQAGLTVTAMTVDTTVVQARQVVWPLHIQATGRYHQAGAFLDQVEREPTLMIVDRLELTAPHTTSAGLTLQLDLTRHQVNPPEDEK